MKRKLKEKEAKTKHRAAGAVTLDTSSQPPELGEDSGDVSDASYSREGFDEYGNPLESGSGKCLALLRACYIRLLMIVMIGL